MVNFCLPWAFYLFICTTEITLSTRLYFETALLILLLDTDLWDSDRYFCLNLTFGTRHNQKTLSTWNCEKGTTAPSPGAPHLPQLPWCVRANRVSLNECSRGLTNIRNGWIEQDSGTSTIVFCVLGCTSPQYIQTDYTALMLYSKDR